MQDQKSKIEKQVHLPFNKAFAIAVKNIRMRFGRSMVTAAGIFLGIAFLSSVLVQGLINSSVGGVQSEDAQIRQQWLVVLALMMSTIGITNSMLMAVTERFKEIGTMKCLGALDKFVVEMFILEGMLLGALASAFGAIIGGGITLIAGGFQLGWNVIGKVELTSLLYIVVGSSVLGAFLTFLATIAPASRAAKLPPAAALRHEI